MNQDKDERTPVAVSRRDALRRSLAVLGAAAAGSAIAVLGCSKKETALSCTDTSALSPSELTIRTSLAYAEASPEAGKTCANCQQFKAPPAPTDCGACNIVKGPINPKGYCKSWIAKT